jgi:hypothetical protein
VSTASSAPHVTAVVVLYQTPPEVSLTLNSLAANLHGLEHRFAVEVHDNSPVPGDMAALQTLEVSTFAHHPDNPGLVGPYNSALDAAERRGSSWLMLLDQDTQVTREYLKQVLAFIDAPQVPSEVAVAAPRLKDGKSVLSPLRPIRLGVRPRPLAAGKEHPHRTCYLYLNSGALMRVSALRAVGGFPDEYPLDFLDHAMSARLKAAGYSLYTLATALEHELAVRDMASVPPARLASIFRSEDQYYAESRWSEAFWMFARRGARAVLLVLGIHRSVHRELEVEAAWRGLRVMATPRHHGRPLRYRPAAARSRPYGDRGGAQ